MKIGLLGGTSYPSTVLYYRKLNELYNNKKGGYHSCPLVLHNIDYHSIKSNYHDGWDKIPNLLKKEILQLVTYKPNCILICNNTLHKALDIIKKDLAINIPIIHIVEITVKYLLDKNIENVLLLGTKFTMEDDFFKNPIAENNINIGVPNVDERIKIQEIQTQLSAGNMDAAFENYFQKLVTKYEHEYQEVILGCTELPIVFNAVKTPLTIINTIDLQCEEAIKIFD